MSENCLIINNQIIDMERSNMFETDLEDNDFLEIVTEFYVPTYHSSGDDGNGNGEVGGIGNRNINSSLKIAE